MSNLCLPRSERRGGGGGGGEKVKPTKMGEGGSWRKRGNIFKMKECSWQKQTDRRSCVTSFWHLYRFFYEMKRRQIWSHLPADGARWWCSCQREMKSWRGFGARCRKRKRIHFLIRKEGREKEAQKIRRGPSWVSVEQPSHSGTSQRKQYLAFEDETGLNFWSFKETW